MDPFFPSAERPHPISTAGQELEPPGTLTSWLEPEACCGMVCVWGIVTGSVIIDAAVMRKSLTHVGVRRPCLGGWGSGMYFVWICQQSIPVVL